MNKKIRILLIKIIQIITKKLNKILDKIVLPQKINYTLSMQQIYSHVQLILRYELLDNVISDKDSMDVLNTVFYNNCNGIILLRACSRAFLERILQEECDEISSLELDFSQMSDKELLEFMPEMYCQDANIVELREGQLKCYLVDYNSDLEKIEGEDFYYDIFRRKGKS